MNVARAQQSTPSKRPDRSVRSVVPEFVRSPPGPHAIATRRCASVPLAGTMSRRALGDMAPRTIDVRRLLPQGGFDAAEAGIVIGIITRRPNISRRQHTATRRRRQDRCVAEVAGRRRPAGDARVGSRRRRPSRLLKKKKRRKANCGSLRLCGSGVFQQPAGRKAPPRGKRVLHSRHAATSTYLADVLGAGIGRPASRSSSR